MANKLAEEWLKSRTFFTTLFFGLFCWLILSQREIPPELNTIVSTLFGYWFGTRKATKGETK